MIKLDFPERDRWDRLIQAVAAARDRAAFAELFAHFAPRIKTYMRRSGSDEAQADELAQETMLAVWRKAGLFDAASASAATWIFTIARNLRIDFFRREQRAGITQVTDIASEFETDPAPLADAQVAESQREARVRSALSELSDEQLDVVELSFFEEKAHAEIAKLLNIPLGTVKSRIRLAVARLRILLGDDA